MERSKDVEATVRRMYDAMRDGDAEAVGELVGEDGVVFVGTDVDEWWQDDPAELRATFREQLEAADDFDIVDEDPAGYSEEDVGWFSDRPSIRLADGTTGPTRHTGVVCRVDGEWRIVRSHLSVGANINERLLSGE